MKKDVALLKSFVNFWKNAFNINKETQFKEFVYAVFCNVALFISTFLITYLLVEVLGFSTKIAAVYMLIMGFYLIVSIIPLITLIIRTVRQMKKC